MNLPNGYRSAVQIALSATDAGSGVDATEYRVDGGAWTAHDEPFTVSDDGEHAVEYRSTDAEGNVEETRSVGVKLDRTAPVLTCAATPNRLWPADLMLEDVTVAVNVADTVGRLRAERGGRGKGRVYTIAYEGRDVAGNTAGCTATVTVPLKSKS